MRLKIIQQYKTQASLTTAVKRHLIVLCENNQIIAFFYKWKMSFNFIPSRNNFKSSFWLLVCGFLYPSRDTRTARDFKLFHFDLDGSKNPFHYNHFMSFCMSMFFFSFFSRAPFNFNAKWSFVLKMVINKNKYLLL